MDTEATLNKAAELLKPWAVETRNPDPTRLDVILRLTDLTSAVQALAGAQWGYLTAITGLDHPAPVAAGGEPAAVAGGSLEVIYHFACKAAVVSLRVDVPNADPTVPSICKWVPTATLFERELIEMFGVSMPDTPNSDRFLLPEDWPDGVYPLRKNATLPTFPGKG